MNIVFEVLHQTKHIEMNVADKAKQQFSKLCSSLKVNKSMKDTLWITIVWTPSTVRYKLQLPPVSYKTFINFITRKRKCRKWV